MITKNNMLECVAAHVLAHGNQRMHITEQQVWASRETPTTLEAWAKEQGLKLEPGKLNGYSGWWVSVAKKI